MSGKNSGRWQRNGSDFEVTDVTSDLQTIHPCTNLAQKAEASFPTRSRRPSLSGLDSLAAAESQSESQSDSQNLTWNMTRSQAVVTATVSRGDIIKLIIGKTVPLLVSGTRHGHRDRDTMKPELPVRK